MKKLMALVLAVMLVVAVLPMCVSARTLTAEEKALFDTLKEHVAVKDGEFVIPADVIAQGENYVASLQNPLTPDQISKIKAEVQAAQAEVKKANTGVVSNWSESTRNAILNHIDNAAEAINCNATANAKGGIDVKDATGATIVTNDKLIKTTGFGAESVAIAGICILSALCACAFVSKKVRLF
ncbi:MAG: hypothetical protein IKJ74_01875 [Clostridia bacterium]|nr:hypothetical protein [Clostridia bacterium]